MWLIQQKYHNYGLLFLNFCETRPEVTRLPVGSVCPQCTPAPGPAAGTADRKSRVAVAAAIGLPMPRHRKEGR
jgi:hypothetical protein